MMLKDINVFIGGSINANMSDCYTSFANELGDLINNRDYKIIFDGCSGLPSIVFKKINEFDRATVCYTEHYMAHYSNWNEYQHVIYRSLQMKNQSEMTDTIIELSDAFIFMKGQLGTLEELFRTINGKKNNEHDSPIVIVNINHEWDDLINILDMCGANDLYYVSDNPIDCLNYIEKQLYSESSTFYKHYVFNGYAERCKPIILTYK